MKKIILSLLLIVFAVSCASNKPVVKEKQEGMTSKQANVPEFIMNPPQSDEVLYGIGSAKTSTDNLSMTLAEDRARLAIASTLSTHVKSMTIDYVKEAGNATSKSSLEFIERVTENTVDTKVNGAKVIKREKMSDGTWYVLMQMKKSDAAKLAAEVIESEAASYAQFEAMNAVKRMNDQLKSEKNEKITVISK